MKIWRCLIQSLSCVLIFDIFFILSLSAQEFEYFGSPPPGKDLIELRSTLPEIPYQFAGTLDPPHVLFNGQTLKLKKSDSSKKGLLKPGFLWNGNQVDLSDEISGRFFFQLDQEDVGTDDIQIELIDKQGELFTANVTQERNYLDGGFYRAYLIDTSKTSETYEFILTEKVSPDSKILVNGVSAEVSSSGLSRVVLPLKIGDSTLIVKLKKFDQPERVLNIPVVVKRLNFQKEQPFLELQVPQGSSPGRSWISSPNGFEIIGRTQPGNKITIKRVDMNLENDEKFKFDFIPSTRDQDLQITIEDRNGKSFTFHKNIKCTECGKEWNWYNPRPWPPKSYFVSGSFLGGYALWGDGAFGVTGVLAPMIGLGFGYHLSERVILEFRTFYFFNKTTTELGSKSEYKGMFLFESPVLVQIFPFLFLGVGPAYAKAQKQAPYQIYDKSGLLAIAQVGLRFGIFEGLEIVPRISFFSISLLGGDSGGIKKMDVLEYLAFRYYL